LHFGNDAKTSHHPEFYAKIEIMSELLQAVLSSDEKADLRQLIGQLRAEPDRYFLRNQILQAFADYCTRVEKPAYFYHTSLLGELLHYTHEILIEESSLWLLLRPRIASQEIFRLAADLTGFEPMPSADLLALRDRWVNRHSNGLLEIDLAPFYQLSPTIRDPRHIGNGLEFLNRYLSSQLFAQREQWLEAILNVLRGAGQASGASRPVLLNDRVRSTEHLSQRVKQALQWVSQRSPHESYTDLRFQLQELGFEPGWGNCAGRIRETLELLDRLLDFPDHAVLEAFISRIPLIWRVALVSIHGWVSQEGVLGRADTAGQVVYVLDQARSLELQLQEDIKLAGLDSIGVQPKVIVLTRLIPNCEGTQCDVRLEKIQGTENAWILRVPFSEGNPQVTNNWISRFEIWPYLESFAWEAERELVAEFQGHPDLIIGNYSDGNLVAFLLARRLKSTHCYIAHALEKMRYLFSNLYWQDLESQYHFSLQFTSDIIAMNAADFILTSTYQEIVGTPESVGYYESYKCFTMPELYHVVNGIELFSPKFNVVPPGVNENVFFPYTKTSDRVSSYSDRIKDLLFVKDDPHIFGTIADGSKRPIFAVAPLSSVKNLTGLVECFGQSPTLQERCNLVFLTSHVYTEQSSDIEEQGEIATLHRLIDRYQLHGKIRCIGLRLSTPDLGEAYRIIADLGGIFVHPARFESFGLIVLEAMISGLPTFATQFGGPSEIIQDGDNGFHINPTDLAGMADKIVQFLTKCDLDPQTWTTLSEKAIERVRSRYNWRLHTKQLLLLTKIYQFWNLRGEDNREALLRYLEALFYLIYKPRCQTLLAEHMQR
jgi:sucrose synthase